MANSKFKRRLKRSLLYRTGPVCMYCKTEFLIEDLTLDHVVPKSAGGLLTLDNLVLACFPCNQRKGNGTYPLGEEKAS